MMKKALIAGLALASLTSLATAGQPATICPAPAPAPCQQPCPYSTELALKYGFAHDNIFHGNSDHLNTYGGDLTLVYHMNKRHSVNLRGGYTFGDSTHWQNGARHETDLHSFYLMPGYRYTHALNENWAAYIGANAGVSNLSVKDNLRGPDYHRKDHNSEYGFSYSGEVGLRYRLCDTKELFLAYEFFGTNARPNVQDGRMHRQTYSVVRTGMSFKF